MQIQFLGTSAGELYPGLWCRCHHCRTARERGGRDRRQSAALHILPDTLSPEGSLLVDFPSEIADQALRHGVDLTRLGHLLVTHSHGDHWFPYLLRWRRTPPEEREDPPVTQGGPRFTPLPRLHVYGNSAVASVLTRELGTDLEPYALEFHPVSPGEAFQAGPYHVTPVPANHDIGREQAVHYLIQQGDVAVLYGLDGDTFLPEAREILRRHRFDLVILESTFGRGDGGNHRNFARVEQEVAWLRAEGLLKPAGRVVATHFSPHHCPPHAETSAYLGERGIETAWDGLMLRIG